MEKAAMYDAFTRLLRRELIQAQGCTEPIAIAYAAAQARAVLGKRPERVRIEVSGNIIKNVKSVVVPHTGSMHGIAAAAAAGIVAGREDRELEVLSDVTQAQILQMQAYLQETKFEIAPIDSPFIFDIRITVYRADDHAAARIVGNHTNLVQLLHGDTRLIDRPCSETVSEHRTDRGLLTVERIVEFADCLDPGDVQDVFSRQIAYNMAIAEAGGDDYEDAGEEWIVWTAANDVMAVSKALEEQGIQVKGSETTMVPTTPTEVSGVDAKKVQRLIDRLEELDDVQDVYSTMDMTDEVIAALEEE